MNLPRLLKKICRTCDAKFLGAFQTAYCSACKDKPRRKDRPAGCTTCGGPLGAMTAHTNSYMFCRDCIESGKNDPIQAPPLTDNEKARQITKFAVKVGFLPHPCDFVCVDCKRRPAECYDHRDYSKPLNVDPVCLRCNSSRGKGVAVHFPCAEYVAGPTSEERVA